MSKTNDPQIDRAIELYALYGIPQTVFKDLKREYGDLAFSPTQVRNIRKKFYKEIIDRRRELTVEIPILDPMQRWAYLQSILDTAMEPSPVFDKQGNLIGEYVDKKNALAAVKLAHELTQPTGSVNEEDYEVIRSIVLDAFSQLKSLYPAKSDDEIIHQMRKELGSKVDPFVEEIKLLTDGRPSTTES